MSINMHMQASPTLSDLPAELLELILLDLPFFDLFQVQRVSRDWNALLGTSTLLGRAMFKSALLPSLIDTFSVKSSPSTGRSVPPRLNPLLTTTPSTSKPEPTPFSESLAYLGTPKSSADAFDSDCFPCSDTLPPFVTAIDNSQYDHQHISPNKIPSTNAYEHDNDPLLDGADSPANTPPPSTPPSLCSAPPSPLLTDEHRSYPPTTITCVLAAGSSLFTVPIPSPASLLRKATARATYTDSRMSVTPSWTDLHVFQGMSCEKVTITMQDFGTPGLLKCITVQNEDEGRGVRIGDLMHAVFPA